MKSYHRPSAGERPALRSEVRPPSLLLRTIDFLCDHVLDSALAVDFIEAHKFVRDRTRALRQDLTLQVCDTFCVMLVVKDVVVMRCSRACMYVCMYVCVGVWACVCMCVWCLFAEFARLSPPLLRSRYRRCRRLAAVPLTTRLRLIY